MRATISEKNFPFKPHVFTFRRHLNKLKKESTYKLFFTLTPKRFTTLKV